MSGQEMLDFLGIRMDDPAEVDFNQAVKLQVLNDAQLNLASLVQDSYLTEIEIKHGNIAPAATGILTFEDLATAASVEVLNGRIRKIKITGGNWAKMITLADLPAVENNSYLTASVTTPYSYVFDESIYVLPAADSPIDVYYLHQPVDISTSAACELAASLHETVLDFAEEALWLTVGNSERAKEAGSRAREYVAAINGVPNEPQVN